MIVEYFNINVCNLPRVAGIFAFFSVGVFT